MEKTLQKYKKILHVKNVENKGENLYLNKYAIKNLLLDNQVQLGLDQNEVCLLNYLINKSRSIDWNGGNPLAYLDISVASTKIYAKTSEIEVSVASLINRNLIASIDSEGTYSLLPLISFLNEYLSSREDKYI